MSQDEIDEFLNSDDSKTTTPTDYAVSRGVEINKGLISNVGIGNASYWLRRTMGETEEEDCSDEDCSDFINSAGVIRGAMHVNEEMGIRPVIRIKTGAKISF